MAHFTELPSSFLTFLIPALLRVASCIVTSQITYLILVPHRVTTTLDCFNFSLMAPFTELPSSFLLFFHLHLFSALHRVAFSSFFLIFRYFFNLFFVLNLPLYRALFSSPIVVTCSN